MSKVYVVQEDPKKNLLPAMEYGEIVSLSPYGQISLDKELIIETIDSMSNILDNFTTNDYLLLVGDPALISIASALVFEKTKGYFKILKWDRQEKKYFPLSFDFGVIDGD